MALGKLFVSLSLHSLTENRDYICPDCTVCPQGQADLYPPKSQAILPVPCQKKSIILPTHGTRGVEELPRTLNFLRRTFKASVGVDKSAEEGFTNLAIPVLMTDPHPHPHFPAPAAESAGAAP